MCNSKMFCVSGIVFVMYYKKNLIRKHFILSNSLCKMTGKTRLYDRNMKVYNIKSSFLLILRKTYLNVNLLSLKIKRKSNVVFLQR